MFKATLFIFDKEYDLITHNISFDQEDDGDGMPNTRVSGGKLEMTYPSTNDDTEMRRVAFSNSTTIAGYVRKYKRDEFQKFYDYEFANAYVLFYKESFTANGPSPLLTKITISPGIVKRDDAIFENIWNPSNPFEKQTSFIVKETDEASLFDEQVKVVDKQDNPIVDLAYCVEFKNKIIHSGKTDRNGLTQRLEQKESKDDCLFYWGDEALLKTDKA